MLTELEELLNEYFEGNWEIEKKEIPKDALKALKEALTDINKYKADFPGDLLKAVGILAKYAGYGYGKYPVKKSGDKFPGTVNAMEKIGGDEKLEFEKEQAALGDPNKKFPSISRFLEPDPLENEGDD